MSKNRKFLYAFLAAFFIHISCVCGQQDTVKVLFVGNSYTYFWNMPQTVEAMSTSSKEVYILARQSTAGGATWKEHWDGEKELESRRLISDGNWDYVVLQNHSMSTVMNLDQFMEYGQKFIELVRSAGAEPILYMTWAREHNPLMQSAISSGYNKLGDAHAVGVIPVGEIWASARKLRPDIRLYDPDGSHPSTIGAYLTATTFFSYFTGNDPEGLPKRIKTTDANGQPLYLSIMSEENASFLQDVVGGLLKEKRKDG